MDEPKTFSFGIKKVIGTKIIKCEKHGEYMSNNIEYKDGSCRWTSCPYCIQDEKEKENIKMQKEYNDRHIYEILQNEMRVKQKYLCATFDTCVPETDKQRKIIDILKKIAANKKGTIAVSGPNGIGKTFFAVSCMRAMLKADDESTFGIYYKMYEIGCMIRATYVGGSKKTELDVIEKLTKYPILIIDEMGRTKASDAELNWLSEIIDDRKADYRPTILLTNRKLAEHCQNYPSGCEKCISPVCFEHYMGNDIMSRLKEESAVMEMDGTDRRGRQ